MNAHIVGTGMTPFGFAPESTVRSLARAAVDEALADAALAASDVDMVVFANAAAGLKCRSLGSRAGLPSLAEVLKAWTDGGG